MILQLQQNVLLSGAHVMDMIMHSHHLWTDVNRLYYIVQGENYMHGHGPIIKIF